MKKIWLSVFFVALIVISSCSKSRQNSTLDPLTGLKSMHITAALSPDGDVVGKAVVGYQGWFSAAGDGSPLNSWQHQNLEMWPDVREYKTTYAGSNFSQAAVTQPNFYGNLGNGQPAKMFSSYDQQVMNTHVLWMKQSGIDCAALQRFGSNVVPGTVLKQQRDGISLLMMNAAQTYGLKFYIMYDCNGNSPMEADWTNTIVGAQNLISSPAYARQNGKPVVCFWGIGFSGRGPVADWLAKINWFKSQGCYVIGGTPGNFSTDTVYRAAYEALDMIMPWFVGKRSNFQASYVSDLAWCSARNIDYQACCYPGFAFNNSNTAKPKNEIPRNHGDFMWSMFAGMRNAGVHNLYIAMFDELNEATSIFKTAEDVSMQPAGNYFLPLDADGVHVSSDFYLRLVKDGIRMVKQQASYQAAHTTPFTLTLPANGTYKIINRGSGLALDAQNQGTANGTRIQQWTYSGGNNQRWILTNIGNNRYKIVGVQSNRSLDVKDNSLLHGAPVQLYDYTGNDNQTWIIAPTTNGYYTIQVARSGMLMEIAGASTSAGATVQQGGSNGGNNQQWIFQAP